MSKNLEIQGRANWISKGCAQRRGIRELRAAWCPINSESSPAPIGGSILEGRNSVLQRYDPDTLKGMLFWPRLMNSRFEACKNSTLTGS